MRSTLNDRDGGDCQSKHASEYRKGNQVIDLGGALGVERRTMVAILSAIDPKPAIASSRADGGSSIAAIPIGMPNFIPPVFSLARIYNTATLRRCWDQRGTGHYV